jgi:hypothetical protein
MMEVEIAFCLRVVVSTNLRTLSMPQETLIDMFNTWLVLQMKIDIRRRWSSATSWRAAISRI